MIFKRKILLISIVGIFAFLGYRYLTYKPGYCPATQHLISDAEFIQYSLGMREGEIASYGGIDAYEKYFIRLNRHPEEAGRDFDVNDPNCCKVYRGAREAKRNFSMATKEGRHAYDYSPPTGSADLLILDAATAINVKESYEAPVWRSADMPTLSSGGGEGGSPATVTSDKIDATKLDYQLAVLFTQEKTFASVGVVFGSINGSPFNGFVKTATVSRT